LLVAAFDCDNGSEFVGAAMDLLTYPNGVILDFSRRGKPTDNAAIESFNGRCRDECLNVHWFASLDDATTKTRCRCGSRRRGRARRPFLAPSTTESHNDPQRPTP